MQFLENTSRVPYSNYFSYTCPTVSKIFHVFIYAKSSLINAIGNIAKGILSTIASLGLCYGSFLSLGLSISIIIQGGLALFFIPLVTAGLFIYSTYKCTKVAWHQFFSAFQTIKVIKKKYDDWNINKQLN